MAVPDRIQNEIYRIIERKYFKNAGNPEYKAILSAALNDAYSKKCTDPNEMMFSSSFDALLIKYFAYF